MHQHGRGVSKDDRGFSSSQKEVQDGRRKDSWVCLAKCGRGPAGGLEAQGHYSSRSLGSCSAHVQTAQDTGPEPFLPLPTSPGMKWKQATPPLTRKAGAVLPPPGMRSAICPLDGAMPSQARSWRQGQGCMEMGEQRCRGMGSGHSVIRGQEHSGRGGMGTQDEGMLGHRGGARPQDSGL